MRSGTGCPVYVICALCMFPPLAEWKLQPAFRWSKVVLGYGMIYAQQQLSACQKKVERQLGVMHLLGAREFSPPWFSTVL